MNKSALLTIVFTIGRDAGQVPTCSDELAVAQTVAGLGVLAEAVVATVPGLGAVTATYSLLRSLAALLRTISPSGPLTPLTVDGIYNHKRHSFKPSAQLLLSTLTVFTRMESGT